MTSPSTLSGVRKYIAMARDQLDEIERVMDGAVGGTLLTGGLSPSESIAVGVGLTSLRGMLDDYETTVPIIAKSSRAAEADAMVQHRFR